MNNELSEACTNYACCHILRILVCLGLGVFCTPSFLDLNPNDCPPFNGREEIK